MAFSRIKILNMKTLIIMKIKNVIKISKYVEIIKIQNSFQKFKVS